MDTLDLHPHLVVVVPAVEVHPLAVVRDDDIPAVGRGRVRRPLRRREGYDSDAAADASEVHPVVAEPEGHVRVLDVGHSHHVVAAAHHDLDIVRLDGRPDAVDERGGGERVVERVKGAGGRRGAANVQGVWRVERDEPARHGVPVNPQGQERTLEISNVVDGVEQPDSSPSAMGMEI